MALMLRWSESEHVLRSVDDSPGIVAISGESGHRFVIDSRWVPSGAAAAAAAAADPNASGVFVQLDDPPALENATDLDTEEAVAAAAGLQEIAVLVMFAVSAIQGALSLRGTQGDIESVRDACEFAITVRDLCNARAAELGA